MKRARHALALLALCLSSPAGLAQTPAGQPLEPVTLQLKWKHQFQFAGYHAAVDKGFYRDAGFEVRLVEPREGEDPVANVLAGKAEYGVGASELALRRAQGEPVVVLATVLQHSPLVLLARSNTIATVQHLDGKRVMLLPYETELFAYLEREGLPRGRIRQVPHTFEIQDLIRGRVEALSAYSTDETWDLRQAKVAHNVFSPRSAGIDFYGDTLFTTESRAKGEPLRVQAFRDASLRGWQYAMDHPEEIADLILEKYSRRHSRDHLLFEAEEMRRLMQPQLVEIGHMNPGRWNHIAGVYAELGMLPANYSLEGFLFDPRPGMTLLQGQRPMLAAGVVIVLLALLVFWQLRKNRALRLARASGADVQLRLRDVQEQLQARLEEIRGLRAQLEAQGLRDPASGLYNRMFLDDALQRECALAQRRRTPLSLLALSSAVGAGDAVSQALAELLLASATPGELACRAEHDEFVLLLPDTTPDRARERAAALRAAFAARTAGIAGLPAACTLHAGIAAFPEHSGDPARLLDAARAALGNARRGGTGGAPLA